VAGTEEITKEDDTPSEIATTQEPHVFGTVQKDDNSIIMIALNNFKGYEYIDVRQWWKPKDGSEYRPTKQGITIPVKHELDTLEEVISSLAKAKEYLDA